VITFHPFLIRLKRNGRNVSARTRKLAQKFINKHMSFTFTLEIILVNIVNLTNFQIHSVSESVAAGDALDGYVSIDATIGKDTTFSFTWSSGDESPGEFDKLSPRLYISTLLRLCFYSTFANFALERIRRKKCLVSKINF